MKKINQAIEFSVTRSDGEYIKITTSDITAISLTISDIHAWMDEPIRREADEKEQLRTMVGMFN
jgi:hypothetical protein